MEPKTQKQKQKKKQGMPRREVERARLEKPTLVKFLKVFDSTK